MQFRFSLKITLACSLLAAAMLKASHWQWERHLQKTQFINTLEERLKEPIVPLASLAAEIERAPKSYVHRRVAVEGVFDLSKEVVLRNRRFEEMPGTYAIAPLRVEGMHSAVLVNRGFLPLTLSAPEKRKQFHEGKERAKFVGLLKGSVPRRPLGPRDPEPAPDSWVDAWLWFDIDKMQKQIPYPILPLSLEIMESEGDAASVKEKMIKTQAGREELLVLPSNKRVVQSEDTIKNLDYPVPVFDTVIPPGRHFGYVFEWGAMAAVTLLIGLILQLRRPRAEG